MYEYKVTINKVVDGDTVDVDIDLGFGVWLRGERVRIMGIDTPESRTSDKVEKLFGKAAKYKLQDLLADGAVLKTQIDKDGDDAKGKFGRILGDFIVDYNVNTLTNLTGERPVTEILIEEGYCVPYFGGSKEDVQAQHMINRERLLNEGIISQEDYDKAVAKMK